MTEKFIGVFIFAVGIVAICWPKPVPETATMITTQVKSECKCVGYVHQNDVGKTRCFGVPYKCYVGW